jgi:hypothetical protein
MTHDNQCLWQHTRRQFLATSTMDLGGKVLASLKW